MSEQDSETELARVLMRELPSAALATLDADGSPYGSYVLTAPAADGAPILLISNLARHTQNLRRDARASLLFVREAAGRDDIAVTPRLTLTGQFQRDDGPESRELFLRRHADAGFYADFADFGFYHMTVTGAHMIAGFGRVMDLAAADLLG